jgi:hypothetical protein
LTQNAVIRTNPILVENMARCFISQMQHDSAATLGRLRSELAGFRGLWPGYEADLQRLGISTLAQLRGRDTDTLAEDYRSLTNRPEDPWLNACFAAVIRFAETGEPVPFWSVMRTRAMREGEAVSLRVD